MSHTMIQATQDPMKAITLDRFGGLETMKLQSCFAYVPIRAVPHRGGRASACPRR